MPKFLWTQRTSFGPSTRFRCAIAYDSNRGRVVLFGGDTLSAGAAGDTWEWDGSYWTQMDGFGPAPRISSAMVYDTVRQVSVLFGGAGGQLLGDTWQWDGGDWTQLSESGPSNRSGHAMAFDSTRGRIVLFGGSDSTTTALGDTWEFDGQDWTQVHDGGPPARSKHCMAHDSVGGTTVLFGGGIADNSVLGDTWAWDGQEWMQIAEFGPAARQFAAMVSIGRGNLILFGGSNSLEAGPLRQIFADTWEFDGKLWTQRQEIGPGPLQGAAMAFDTGRSRIVLFGGENGGTPSASPGLTWESPIAQADTLAALHVSSLSVPANIHATVPTTLTVKLSGPAPQGGAVVDFGPTVFKPNLSHLPTVTIPAGLTALDVPVGFPSPGTATITGQISGTPTASIAVSVLP